MISMNELPLGIDKPNTKPNCLNAIKIPAPAVKPIITEWETKLTNFANLNNPISN